MEIHADLIDVYNMESTVFPTAPFADGLRDSELEKSALKMVTRKVNAERCMDGS